MPLILISEINAARQYIQKFEYDCTSTLWVRTIYVFENKYYNLFWSIANKKYFILDAVQYERHATHGYNELSFAALLFRIAFLWNQLKITDFAWWNRRNCGKE